jgi:bifunctional aspartokinase / homoserine dehydrogenase 1
MPQPRPTIHVHKFGGASLADSGAYARAVEILSAAKGRRVVVASAMSGVTDALLATTRHALAGEHTDVGRAIEELRRRHETTARALSGNGAVRRRLLDIIGSAFDELATVANGLAILRELTPRTSDYVVARGERLSAQLLAVALEGAGIDAQFIDASEIVRTDNHYGGASPEIAASEKLIARKLGPLLSKGTIPVVPGFYGTTSDGHIATLGRGGTDLTATLVARSLKARDVTLWKDVPGLLTADPRIVSEARVIPQLTQREAAELAYYGAKVLHPRALIPLQDRTTPIHIKPFAEPAAHGTEISPRHTLREYPVKALSVVGDQTLVTVAGNGMLGVPGIAARAFGALHNERVSVSLISQASSEHSICFTVPAPSAERARRALLDAFRDEIQHKEIDGVEVQPGVATIAVVGMGMSGTPGIAARVFEALAGAGINVIAIAQGSSELNISAVIQGRDTTAALRRVHGTFQLDRIGGGRIVAREMVDVVLLGFGQIGQALTRMLPKSLSDGAALRIVGVIDRSGFVFEAKGFSTRALTALRMHKRGSGRISTLEGATGGTASESLREIARHALQNPILVDVTADDTTPALRLALTSGMDLVLANKRPLGGRLADARGLLDLAASNGRRLLHETTVGAGLPIIDTFHKLAESGDRVLRIDGCTSGTLGYLLSEIERGSKFSAALRRAMELGYTEPDPRDDLSGMDVARKALILARLIGFGGELADIKVESLVPVEGRALSREEFVKRLTNFDDAWERRAREARAKGHVLRYIASITKQRVRVGLAAVPGTSPFAALKGTDNQVAFTTTRYRENPLVITGPGAGPAVTAAGVVNDVLKLASA